MAVIPVRLPVEVASAYSPRDIANLVKQDYSQRATPFKGDIDLQPADGGRTHTQKKWGKLYDSQEGEFSGKRMIVAPDGYRAGKSNSPALESIQQDMDARWLVTRSGIHYEPKTLDGRIVHPRGIGIKPIEKRLLIPVYQNAKLDEVLGTGNGVTYMRALLNTNDDENTIAQTLSAFSKRDIQNIYIWTSIQEIRAERSEGAVVFGSNGEGFLLGGDGLPDGGVSGLSRGVSVQLKSAKPTRQK